MIRGVGIAFALASFLAATAFGDTPPLIVYSADNLPSVAGEIYRVDLDGRVTDLSNSPFDDTSPVVSPDGKRVAFLSARLGALGAYVLNVAGGKPVRVGLSVSAIVGWSPDSRQLAIMTAKPLDSSTLRVATPGNPARTVIAIPFRAGPLYDVAWSPDGRLFSFRVGTEGAEQLRGVTTSGHEVFRMKTNLYGPSEWSKTGHLAIRGSRNVRVLDEHGRVLATIPTGNFERVAWSPNGRRLATMNGAVVEVRDGGGTGRVILRRTLIDAQAFVSIRKVLLNLDPNVTWRGDNRLAVQWPEPKTYRPTYSGFDLSTHSSWTPTTAEWMAMTCSCASPDGRLYATTAKSGDGFVLQAANVDGTAQTLEPVLGCTNDGGPVAAVDGLQFANAGRSIVYQTTCYEAHAHLYAVPAAGGKPTQLTSGANQVQPRRSPDGTRIAYAQTDNVSLTCKGCPSTIWVSDADGTNARRRTLPNDNLVFDGAPSWSPDGRTLVFARSSADAPTKLMTVPAADGVVTDLKVEGDLPAWGPTRIAYATQSGIWTMRPDGGDRSKIANGYAISLAWSADGRLAWIVNGDARTFLVEAQRRITLPFARVTSLAWLGDGFVVTGRRARTGPSDVYVLDANGKVIRRVTTNVNSAGAD